MNVWTVILAGIFIASLPNMGNGALEDGGMFMSINYTKFERRVWPAGAPLACTYTKEVHEWFRINIFEQLLQRFESGNNTLNATFSLGTPAVLYARNATNEFEYPVYCKYVPKAYHSKFMTSKTVATISGGAIEYFALKVNDTGRATIKKGWNNLINRVKNRFPKNPQANYQELLVEKTAAGVVYVGAIQRVKY